VICKHRLEAARAVNDGATPRGIRVQWSFLPENLVWLVWIRHWLAGAE
jgi:hypothetical protein